MHWLHEARRRVAMLFHRDRFDGDLEEEMRSHVEMQAEENLENGMDAAEARQAAQRQFGNATLLQEDSRAEWNWHWLGVLSQDLRYAARTLRKNAGFSIVVVVTLALGIGANAAIFSVLNAVLLRDLGVGDPSTLVEFEPNNSFSYPEYLDFRNQGVSFDGLCAAYLGQQANLRLTSGDSIRVTAQVVTANFFRVAGVPLALGRGFLPTEDEAVSPVVVLSDALWRKQFGADTAVVGKGIRINDASYTVVGVAPRGFRGLVRESPIDLWVPLSMTNQMMPWAVEAKLLATRDQRGFNVFGRLKHGITVRQARAEMAVLGERVRPRTESTRSRPISLESAGAIRSPMTRQFVQWSGVLMAVVAVLLLIACFNVANLLMARALTRRKEMGIRLAIGASRGRILRQLLTESLLLAGMGAAAGFAVAVAITGALSRVELPALMQELTIDVSPDGNVLLFTAALAILTGLLFGLTPVLGASGEAPIRALRTESNSLDGLRIRSLLVAAQVALSVLLLVCGGLFLRSLAKTMAIDLGFRSDHVLMANLDVLERRYSAESRTRVLEEVEERLAALSGVRNAALVNIAPLSNYGSGSGFRPDVPGNPVVQADVRVVSPRYFETLGIPILRGRGFSRGRNSPSAILSETAARRFFQSDSPLGRLVWQRNAGYEVIGVVPDAKLASVGEDPQPALYLPVEQGQTRTAFGMSVLVKTAADPITMAVAVRDAVAAVDPALFVFGFETMDAHVRKAQVVARLSAMLFGGFALLGLAIASVGLYGMMSYVARCRRKETAIRAALGASRWHLLARVVNKGMLLVLGGLAAGLACAMAVTRAVSSFLFGIEATDAVTFLTVPVVLIVAALAAVAIPARRAARVDPMEVLRYE